ncbi:MULTISPECIES: porin [Paraburkholderia]|uniref:Porin n=1 Tax=Paraburkholderia madseniana TaxID=2599607 RepID=A0AAP5B9P7_9BURK|nr:MULTISPECIES: porin [Paraburkholderia]MCX4144904.1 porin [Paraburkholderia madseniana]MCX4176454.1 porin [Paraburkholderia madseniana]MDN7147856.1 porin [Paraburkholderia sp. WS6]MDQ6406736.1 porin [Paraburkholderia madseniana]MDQ6464446.1 porin [Paraburkholderia madseniana]
MKRTTFSIISLAALTSAGAAHAQSSVTLYGTIDTSLTYVHNAQGDKNLWALGNSSAGNLSGTRWGLKGTEDLGAGLKAIFQLENGFDPSTGKLGQGSRLFGRQAYVGLTSDSLGSVTLGRQYDPLIDLVQGITEDNYFGSAFATAGDVDNYDNSFRVNNAVKYTSPVWSGLQFEAMYSFGGIAGSTGSEQSYSAAAAYNNGPIALAAGYFYAANSPASAGPRSPTAGWNSTSDGTFDGPINSGYQTAHSLGIARVAGQYTLGQFTLGAAYSNSQYRRDSASVFASNEKYNTGQGFVNYQATKALLVGLGYSYTKSSGDTSATYHQVSLGADYSLSKRTDVYVTAAYQHASGETGNGTGGTTAAQASIGSYGYAGTSRQEMVNLGLRHKF